jgi:hypothetical protein
MNYAYSYQDSRDDDDDDDSLDRNSTSRELPKRQRKSRRNSYAQKSRPAVHSGIHRRRNKRFGM